MPDSDKNEVSETGIFLPTPLSGSVSIKKQLCCCRDAGVAVLVDGMVVIFPVGAVVVIVVALDAM